MIKKLLFTLLAIFGFTFLFSGDTFAVSDVTYTIDQDTANNTDFCNSSCSTYKYIYVHDIVLPSSGLSVTFKLSDRFDNVHVLNFAVNSRFLPTFQLYNVDLSTLSQNAFIIEKNSYPSNVNWSFKVTLSENNPTESPSSNPSGSLSITENGTYDVTNYAEAVVNVPEPICEDCDDNFIVSAFKTIFVNFAVSIIPVCAIVFVVWFMIDMITSFVYGRGR